MVIYWLTVHYSIVRFIVKENSNFIVLLIILIIIRNQLNKLLYNMS